MNDSADPLLNAPTDGGHDQSGVITTPHRHLQLGRRQRSVLDRRNCRPTIAREKQTALSRAHAVLSQFLRTPNQAELEAFAAAKVSRAMRLAVIAAARAPWSFLAVATAPS